MRTLIISIFIFTSAFSYGQKRKTITKKINKTTKETYTIVIEKGKSKYRDGKYKVFTPYNVLIEGNYKKGIKIGTWINRSLYGNDVTKTFYRDNGSVDSIYINSSKVEKGEKYSSTGTLLRTYWYTSQRKVQKTKTTNGTLYFATQNNGYIVNDTVVKGLLVNEKRDGKWHFKNSDGTSATINYQDGDIFGNQISYHSSGTVLCTKTIDKHGKKQGRFLISYDNGDSLFYGNYANGKLDGYCTAKYSDSETFYTCTYDNGKLTNYKEFNNKIKDKTSKVTNGKGTVYNYIWVKGKRTISSQNNFTNGLLDGTQTSYNSDTITEQKIYNMGVFKEYTKHSGKLPLTTKKNEVEYFSPQYFILDTSKSIKAKYPYGTAGLNKFLAENVTYPSIAIENDIQGEVIVIFVVSEEGEVEDAQILGSKKGFGLDEESIRIIELMSGQWVPASQFGFPVKIRFKLPIKFQLF